MTQTFLSIDAGTDNETHPSQPAESAVARDSSCLFEGLFYINMLVKRLIPKPWIFLIERQSLLSI